MQLTPYIIFNGNCEEALHYYAKSFEGENKKFKRFEGSPVESLSSDKQKVMDANFNGNGIFFMAI